LWIFIPEMTPFSAFLTVIRMRSHSGYGH